MAVARGRTSAGSAPRRNGRTCRVDPGQPRLGDGSRALLQPLWRARLGRRSGLACGRARAAGGRDQDQAVGPPGHARRSGPKAAAAARSGDTSAELARPVGWCDPRSARIEHAPSCRGTALGNVSVRLARAAGRGSKLAREPNPRSPRSVVLADRKCGRHWAEVLAPPSLETSSIGPDQAQTEPKAAESGRICQLRPRLGPISHAVGPVVSPDVVLIFVRKSRRTRVPGIGAGT